MQRPMFPSLDTPRAARTAPRGRQEALPLGAALGCSTRTGHVCQSADAPDDPIREGLARAMMTGPIVAATRGGWRFVRAEVRPDLAGDGVVAIFAVNGRDWPMPLGEVDLIVGAAIAESIHRSRDSYTDAADKRACLERHLRHLLSDSGMRTLRGDVSE